MIVHYALFVSCVQELTRLLTPLKKCIQSAVIMGKRKEEESTAEKPPEVFSKSDVVELLNWVASVSPFYPRGKSSFWGDRRVNQYCSTNTESIINEFIKYKQEQQSANTKSDQE